MAQMSRIAVSRRGVAASVSEAHVDGKPKRVPLARISDNPKVRASGVDRLLKPAVSEPVIPIAHPRPGLFSHRELPIGMPDDPQDVAEFEHIIYRTLRGKEAGARRLQFPQSEITLRDRNLLIDALDRFHYKLSLSTNGLYRFIGILDRYLSAVSIPKQKLRVVGCAALLIASKIEDIYPAQSRDLIQLSEHAFTQSELFATEIQIANTIQFDTTFATPLFFLTQFMRIEDQTKESLLLGRYILELCQTSDKFHGIASSLMAAVATLTARTLLGDRRWPPELADYTQYSEADLQPHLSAVRAMLQEPDREESQFIRRKYSSEPFRSVAHVRLPVAWRESKQP
jgi:cyclin B